MSFSSLDDSGVALLSPAMEERVRAELADGEKLAWVGRPRPGRMVLVSIPIFVFGIFFGGFAVFWTVMASHAPFPMALFGLPFIAVGFGMLASPFWSWYSASRTCYAVTGRRAITWEPGLWDGCRVRSYAPDHLRRMWRNERGDGSGDLVFEEITTYGARGRRNVTRRGFFAIEDVRSVESLIRSTFPNAFDPAGRMKFDLDSP
jgi:hypothetical protein